MHDHLRTERTERDWGQRMDEDENLSLLLSMGFPDIEEAQRALRAAKNDLNEAVRQLFQP